MPFVELESSPHAANAPKARPVRIHYRDVGHGRPVVFLQGGWGYGVYPINRQVEALKDQARILIPDRSGHGQSSEFAGALPIDFHRRAAQETLLMLDALGIDRAVIWGHSDGAVIAATIGLMAPARCSRLVLEAVHFWRDKPSSREFFTRFADHPEEVSYKLQSLLAADHGERWADIVRRNCRVWLELARLNSGQSNSAKLNSGRAGDLRAHDLYDGRLGELTVPVTFLHGRGDPRTEPAEMESVHEALPNAEMRFIENGRHSPHSEESGWQEVNNILREVNK